VMTGSKTKSCMTGGPFAREHAMAAHRTPASRRKQAAQDFDSKEGFEGGTFLFFVRLLYSAGEG
jgi:hypothetical protein